jgi:ATP-dependent 26S proteasome regulatory subunit
LLREELQLLQEQGSYVGEVVRAMDKKKVLVKVKAALTPGTACHPLHFLLRKTGFCHVIL